MELLIVMILLTMVIGVVGINLSGVARQEKFRTSTAFLVDRLQLAQDIMVIFGADVTVQIKPETGGLGVRLNVDKEMINKSLATVLRPVHVQGIDTLIFTDANGVAQSNPINLLFMSKGTKMSQGMLTLSAGSAEADLVRYILLAGYPQVIRASSTPPPKPEDSTLLSNRLYPIEVTEREQKKNATS